MTTAPLLSIGIIFKNEKRCIERCLQSLAPLREAVLCELVMADTGAEDGSRAIAEQYADTVIDFPWVDDFAAARNAVMDQCTGQWYLSVDCDEWLDKDISELLAFLKKPGKTNFAFVIQRNYSSAELEKSEEFGDFRALRLMRMATGERFHGAIHETWRGIPPVVWLNHTILHHDGYVYVSPEAAKKKMRRNMALLREEHKKRPKDLRTLNQCIESGKGDAHFIQYLQRAVKLVQERHGGWKENGPVILRHAVEAAQAREMPELPEWLDLAEKLFPHSIYTQVDVNYAVFMGAVKEKEWERAIRYGEAYRAGLRALRADPLPPQVELELGYSVLNRGTPAAERNALIALSDAYLQAHQAEAALKTLRELKPEKLLPHEVQNMVVALCHIHAQSTEDVLPDLKAFYEQLSREPDEQKKKARLAAFDSIAAFAFEEPYQKVEQAQEAYIRPAYTAFRVLADQCEAGRAAAVMTADSPAGMRALLEQVENWAALPVEALRCALEAGVAFPLTENPVNIEVLDGLAARLTRGDNFARQAVLAMPETPEPIDVPTLYWTQSLALAALRTFDWTMKQAGAARNAGADSAQLQKACMEFHTSPEPGRPADFPTKDVPPAHGQPLDAQDMALFPELSNPASLPDTTQFPGLTHAAGFPEDAPLPEHTGAADSAAFSEPDASDALSLPASHSEPFVPDSSGAPLNTRAQEAPAEREMSERASETGFALIRRFAQVEAVLLPRMYAPQALTEGNAAMLPPMHRWGLYCALAFEALNSGNPQEYLSTLRRGLKACPGQKDMVQFLLDRFLEDARPKASPELLALAEKVRTILAAYAPDNPAVAAIRESPAYQQVAWLIEPPVTQLVQ